MLLIFASTLFPRQPSLVQWDGEHTINSYISVYFVINKKITIIHGQVLILWAGGSRGASKFDTFDIEKRPWEHVYVADIE